MVSRRTFLRGLGAGAALTLVRPFGGLVRGASDAVSDALHEWVPSYFTPNVPRGVQLSFDADPIATRTVTWLTSGPQDLGSWVEFGAVPADASETDIASGRFVTRRLRGSSELAPLGEGEGPEDSAAFFSPYRSPGPPKPDEVVVRVHRARMEDLAVGGRIAYRVGDGVNWTSVRTFEGSPRLGEGFSFTHFGDHGTRLASRRNAAAAAGVRPDWHLMAGDIAYANGDQRLWDVWAEQVMPLGASVPIMSAPGNHEANDFMGQTYRARFSYPNHGLPWYSFDYRNVHVVSTTAGAFGGDVQVIAERIRENLLFLELDLAQAALRRALGQIDFIVVMQHFPNFTDHDTRGPLSPELVVAHEHILQRYQIDMLLVGHDHMYQRSHPMAYGVPTSPPALQTAAGKLGVRLPVQTTNANAAGYVQVIAGGGGSSLYEFTEVDTFEPRVDPNNTFNRHMPWLAASRRRSGFVAYDVQDNVIRGTAYGFADNADANDAPYNADAVDTTRPPEVIDRFEVRRKPFAGEVPTLPRAASVVLKDVPEVRGTVVRNRADDCTLDDH